MTTFLEVLGSLVALSPLFYFIVKHWIVATIKSEYDQRLERLKAELKGEYDQRLENLKAELAQQSFRYSHVFERTANTIAELYRLLLDLSNAVKDYTDIIRGGGDPLEKQRRGQKVHDTYQSFSKEFEPKKIFLPKQTSDRIKGYLGTLHRLIFNYQIMTQMERAQIKDVEALDKRRKTFEEVDELTPNLLGEIENELRTKILGLPDETKKA
jgi:hypothetical protein